MTVGRRVVMILAVLAALVPAAVWAFAALIFWAFRNGIFGPTPPEAVASNIRVAGITACVAVLNLIAIVAFLLTSRSYAWWLLVGVEVGSALSLLAWMILGHYTDLGSIGLFTSGAAGGVVATLLLLVFRCRRRSIRPGASVR